MTKETESSCSYTSLNKLKNTELLVFLDNKIDFILSKTLPILSEEENIRRNTYYNSENTENNQNNDYYKERKTMTIQSKYNNPTQVLDNKERRTVNVKIKKKTSFKDEEKSDFWKELQKKYKNFKELGYLIDNDLNYVNSLYEKYIFYSKTIKNISKNKYFDYIRFLYKDISKSAPEKWVDYIVSKCNSKEFLLLNNIHGYWLSIFLNQNYRNIKNKIIYNSDLSSKSMIITIDLYYKELLYDVYTLLFNRPYIERIIIEIKQRSFWINKQADSIYYIRDDEWNKDINLVLNVIFSIIKDLNSLVSLSIKASNDCEVSLSFENSSFLNEILEKKSISILTIQNLSIFHSQKEIFLRRICGLRLKMLILQLEEFEYDENMMGIINSRFGFGIREDIIYIRFNERVIFLGE